MRPCIFVDNSWVSNSVFYAQSTIAVISGRDNSREKKNEKKKTHDDLDLSFPFL